MSTALHASRVPRVWRIAFLGAGASLPAAALLNWLPNAEATVGGAVMMIGASIAGALAAGRAADPSAVGLRAGFLGGVVAILTFVVTDAPTATWSMARVAFFVAAGGAVLCVAPVFGVLFGRVGGWVANAIMTRDGA